MKFLCTLGNLTKGSMGHNLWWDHFISISGGTEAKTLQDLPVAVNNVFNY